MERPGRRGAAATLVLCLAAVLSGPGRAGPAAAADPHAGHVVPRGVPVAVAVPGPVPRRGWTVQADSVTEPHAAERAVDGDPDTLWRSADTALPHTLTVDTHDMVAISGLEYRPPADPAAGRIGQYAVWVSTDGAAWGQPVATGTFADDGSVQKVTVGTVVTRFVRISASTEAAGRGSAVGVAELDLLGGVDPALPRNGWTVGADSQETATGPYAAATVLDGNTATFWHTAYSRPPAAPLPHRLTVDMRTPNLVSGLAYLPRQGASRNGAIGRYRVETSMDGTTWGPAVAAGTFADTAVAKTVTFEPALARYVRLVALSEAGNRGPWSSAAELNVLGRANPALARTGWTVAADSQHAGYPATAVLDGSAATFWHTSYTAPPAALPHTLTVDLKSAVAVGGLTYLPRPAASPNGRIGRYSIATSTDGTSWTTRVANDAFADSPALQTSVFPPVTARYVRLTAHSEAGRRGPWTAVAELGLLGPIGAVPPQRGRWDAPVGFPLVPVAAAQLPDGKVLTWSAYAPNAFSGGRGKTVTATYDPATGTVSQRVVTETGHDMFCPGISYLPDGRVMVTGGNDSGKTSFYTPATGAWTAGPVLTTPRGYHSGTTLSDGRVFTIGGSWNGGIGGIGGRPHKHGEVWSPATGWRALPGALADPMLTADANPDGDYRKDNHAWLFAWSGGRVLQAGPSRRMNWYTTTGTGGVSTAGFRGDDNDAMNGTAVMYDAGRILTVGGARSYEGIGASTHAYVVTIDGSTVSTRRVADMANARGFHSSVVLPDGRVLVVGGQNFPAPFSDNTAVLSAEMWDPATESFSRMAPAVVPRTYHSIALLMTDGRVFSGGGGLCGNCPGNHFDGEVFTPPYLLNPDGSPASRPVITAAPATAANGSDITVTTDRPVTAFSLVRMSTVTHTVNTDQRRIALAPEPVDGGYRLAVPADRGVALPGPWMLFALDAKGVPSVARTITVG